MNSQPILPQQQQVKINLNDLERFQCESCHGEMFDIVYILHKVPALLSRSGKETLLPVAYFQCMECGTVSKVIKQ